MKSVAKLRVIINHDNVLNSNAEFTIFVESRLVRYTHAHLKLNLAASVNALGSLMDAIE